jgi:5'(3')-deoxyribonucleotidase
MNKKPTIAVDIDDVLADSTEAYRIKVNEQSGANLRPHHYQVKGDYWGYYERIWAEHGIVANEDELDAEMISDQTSIPLLAGAEFAIGELSKKYNIVIVTARNPLWEGATKDWLKHHFGNSTLDLYFSEAHRSEGKKTKGQLCKDLGASWLIDDNIGHCSSALDEGIKAILFGEYGWHGEVPEGIVRCSDWPKVLEYFDGK